MPKRKSQYQPLGFGNQDQSTSCKYAGRACPNERALKANGCLHSYCEHHRVRANTSQRESQRAKRHKPQDMAESTGLTTLLPLLWPRHEGDVFGVIPVPMPFDMPQRTCTYPNCQAIRAAKSTGKPHRFCSLHREMARLHQSKYTEKRKATKDPAKIQSGYHFRLSPGYDFPDLFARRSDRTTDGFVGKPWISSDVELSQGGFSLMLDNVSEPEAGRIWMAELGQAQPAVDAHGISTTSRETHTRIDLLDWLDPATLNERHGAGNADTHEEPLPSTDAHGSHTQVERQPYDGVSILVADVSYDAAEMLLDLSDLEFLSQWMGTS